MAEDKVMFMRLQVAAAVSCWIAIIGQTALAAESCPRGALDAKYCDRDGDMVADMPTDPKQLSDPDTLIFAYTPLEDPAVYVKMWDRFIEHLEKTTGKKVKLFLVQSNAAQFEALRAGRLHITGANTGGVPMAVNCAGFVPFTMMSSPDQPFASHMEIIVPASSAIQPRVPPGGHSPFL